MHKNIVSTALPPYLPRQTIVKRTKGKINAPCFIKKTLVYFSLVHYGALTERGRTYMSSRRVLWCDWRETRGFSRCRLTAAKGDEARRLTPLREYSSWGKAFENFNFRT